jgi:hypothetical protein
MTRLYDELAKKVRDALLSHEAFNENWNVDLIEDGGVITLMGSVPAKEDLEIIESLTREQEGVINVINELNIADLQQGLSEFINKSTDSSGHNIRILTPRR